MIMYSPVSTNALPHPSGRGCGYGSTVGPPGTSGKLTLSVPASNGVSSDKSSHSYIEETGAA